MMLRKIQKKTYEYGYLIQFFFFCKHLLTYIA